MGVCKALHGAEQKQRRTQPPQHSEPLRDDPSEFKKVMDVIQHHHQKSDEFKLCSRQTLLFLQRFFHLRDLLFPFDGFSVTEISVEIMRMLLS